MQPEGDAASATPYELSSTLELPSGFGADLGAVIAAQAATAINPVYERAGEALASLIEPVVAKLKPVAENPSASFSGDARAQLWRAYADGEQLLGEECGDSARLASAIVYFRKVLPEWTRERVPVNWAKMQHNLGTACEARQRRGDPGLRAPRLRVSLWDFAGLARTMAVCGGSV